jgi:hypothetical protein
MAVTLADIRARVLDVSKRKDIPLATLDRFITDAIRRIQRTLRTPMTEAQAEMTAPVNFQGRVNVPPDLLNLISLQVGGVELQMRSITEVNRFQKIGVGHSNCFARVGGQYLVAPIPVQGTLIHIDYHQDLSVLVNDTDTNILIDVVPDLVMYGTLISLGDWALDQARQATWAQAFATMFTEIQEQADRDILINASIGACTPMDGYYL